MLTWRTPGQSAPVRRDWVPRSGTSGIGPWRPSIEADPLTVLIPSALPSAVGNTPGPCDADVDKVRRTNVFDAAIVTGSGAEIVKEPFAAPQQDRHDRQMHFIDERSTQVLPDGGCATSDKDIAVTGRLKGRTECGFSPAIDEIKLFRPSFR